MITHPICEFRGELFVTPDGDVHGHCLDPARPGLRCWVEILLEDRLVATVLARDLDDDLAAQGATDPAHGFRVRVPPARWPARPDVLVWARVRHAKRGFAQRLLSRPTGATPAPERQAALAARIADLSDGLLALCRRPVMQEPAWRALSDVLAGRPSSLPQLPFIRRPAISFVLPAGPDLGVVLRRIAWLAPLVGIFSAELVVLPSVPASNLCLLPSMIANLRLGPAAGDLSRAAATHARGERVVVLDPDDPDPSRAVLEHVVRAERPVMGPLAPDWLPDWRLPASPGLLAALPRRTLDAAGWPAAGTPQFGDRLPARRAMRLPAERFVSWADHAAWQVHHALALTDRDLVEAAPPVAGSCASCLRATAFCDGRCDCPDRLESASRLLLHAARAEAGLCGWTRLRLIARSGAVADRLAGMAGSVVEAPCDAVILDRLTDPAPMLRSAKAGLSPGGCLLAVLAPFNPDDRRCWGVLDDARAAGFAGAEILRPWSRELGYLGDGLWLLKAVA